jgi:hypothetical protein
MLRSVTTQNSEDLVIRMAKTFVLKVIFYFKVIHIRPIVAVVACIPSTRRKNETALYGLLLSTSWAGIAQSYSYSLQAGRSGDGIPVKARFSAPVQTEPGAHPASCTMSAGSLFPGGKAAGAWRSPPTPI